MGLVIPALSITGVLLIQSETNERRPIDWRILGGGIAFGIVVVSLGLGDIPAAQEIVFTISMVVICWMLVLVTRALDAGARQRSGRRRPQAMATSGGRSTCSSSTRPSTAICARPPPSSRWSRRGS